MITYLNVFKKWEENNYSSNWCYKNYINEKALNEAHSVREMLLEKMDQNKEEVVSCGQNYERVQKAIAAGLALNVAKRVFEPLTGLMAHFDLFDLDRKPNDRIYHILQNKQKPIYLHSSSGLHNKVNHAWCVLNFFNFSNTTKTKFKTT